MSRRSATPALLPPQRFQRSLELEAVLQQRQIHVERLRSHRLDLRDDRRQLSPASASTTDCWSCSGVSASSTLGIPQARATPARFVPVEVAVGKPPTESRLSLSKTTWSRLPGR